MNKNKKHLLFASSLLIFVCTVGQVKSQPELPSQAQPPPAQVQQNPTETQKVQRHFFFFKRDELGERQRKERTELLERQRKERNETWEKQTREKKDAREKQEQERIGQKNLQKKVLGVELKNKQIALDQIYKREKEINKARFLKRSVQIVTNENDPLYIANANVLDTKTKFLKIKNVEFKYKVELQNQTPKIINSALLVWERKMPFTKTLTISKETKISKPIIPYEKRVVEYNELDSKREGETYRLKVAKVIFEDGTQWINPTKVSYKY